MANDYFEKYLTSQFRRAVQVKNTLLLRLTPLRKDFVKATNGSRCWGRVSGERGPLVGR